MKKTKKIVALVVVMVMMLAVVATVLTACDNSNTLIWVSESNGVVELTKKQIEEFNKTWTGEFKIQAKVVGMSESDSASQVLTDVESAPDIFCFAQDQTARLQQANALSAPGAAAQTKIAEENDADSLTAVKVGGKIVCYPLTSDNGYFMIYDKRVITDSVDKTDLAALVKACEDYKNADGKAEPKKFSMELGTSAWYVASFFFGAGCHSTWTTDAKGEFASVDDDWNSDKGLIAMRGMQILGKSDIHVSSSDAADFGKGSAVVVTGTWGLKAAIENLGADNVGYAELPYFTVDGQKYHMSSFKGNKLMGVKPQTDSAKAQAMHALAQYLTSKECQLQRYDEFGWGPSNLAAQAEDRVKKDAALNALGAQNAYAVVQGQIHGGWWDVAKVLGVSASDKDTAKDDIAKLTAALEKYEGDLKGLLEMTPEQKRAWTIIGKIGGTNWDTDLTMTETAEGSNIWISDDAFEFTAGDDENATKWVFRMGKNWDYKVAANNGEVAIRWAGSADISDLSLAVFNQAAGTYKLKLTLTFEGDKAVAATVEFLAA